MINQRLRRLSYFASHPYVALHRLYRARPLPYLMRRGLGFPSATTLVRELEALARTHRTAPMILFPLPGSPWSYLFQRPHQLAAALARAGCLVIYAVETDPRFAVDHAVRGLQRVEERLYLYSDGVAGATLAALADRLIVWQYWPAQRAMIERHLPDVPVLYDCIDAISLFPGRPATVAQQHQESLIHAARVFASATALVRKIKPTRPDVVALPNACAYDHFHSPLPDSDVRLDRDDDRPVIGFAGAIAPWLDMDLLFGAAAARPNYRFVLIGEDQIGLTRSRRIASTDNIEVRPALAYHDLPAALARFDVAIIPFKRNAVTEAACPIKLFEYFAAGKPVVSTDLPECRAHEPVLIASSVEEFVAALDRARNLARDVAYCDRLDACARANTWAERARVILQAIDSIPELRSRN